MNKTGIIALLRTEIRKAGSLRKWAKKQRISPSYVSDVVNRRYAPGPAIVKALGFEVQYRKKS